MRRRLPVLATAFAAAALLSACAAQQPTFGERLQSQGSAVSGLGDAWVEGNRKVVRGEDLIAKGRKQIEEGQDAVRRGEKLVQQGREQMARAERRYDRVSQAE